MTRHSGISIDDDGVTLVVASRTLVTGPGPIAFAPLGDDGCDRPEPDLPALTISRLVREHGSPGDPDQQLTIAFPAGWEPRRVAGLRAELARVGVAGPNTYLIPRPVAAVRAMNRPQPGPAVVVDIGRCGAEVSTLSGGPVPRVTGVYPADLGTAELDWVVLGHVLEEMTGELPERVDRRDLVARCHAAWQELVDRDATVIEVPVVGGVERVRIARAAFEAGIHRPVAELVACVARAFSVDRAGERAGLERPLLVTGDVAGLPLLAEVLWSRRLPRPWRVVEAAAIATGAAQLSADRAGAVRAERLRAAARARAQAAVPAMRNATAAAVPAMRNAASAAGPAVRNAAAAAAAGIAVLAGGTAVAAGNGGA